MDVFEEKIKVHQIQLTYTFENFKEYQVFKAYLEDKMKLKLNQQNEFESFLDEAAHSIFGDCITSSFHVLEKLYQEGIPASYIEGHFFDPDKKKLIHHIVPCVIHKIDKEPATLSFLDFSREYYMELIPDIPKISPKAQEFVWKNGFVYQIYKDSVKRKTSTKDGEHRTSCYNVFKIVDYQKEKYLKYFQSKYDELLKNYESWEEITFTYQPLNIEEKFSVVSIIDTLKGSDKLSKKH